MASPFPGMDPLAEGDPEVSLDLQRVFTTVYDRTGYDYALDYQRPIEPPLVEADAAWAAQLLPGVARPSE